MKNKSYVGRLPIILALSISIMAHGGIPTAGVPIISGFIPASGTNGSVVTIIGTNFSTTAASNIVYFGAVQATVSTSSSTSLTVVVPVGATYAPISVTTGGLTAWSSKPFMPTFIGAGSGISATNFGPVQDLPTLNGPNQTVIADIDGDGKPDLIVVDDYNNAISIYRNIGTNGILTTASFAPPVVLPTTSRSYSPYGIAVADLDGDGKLDIIVTENGNNLVSVYKNNCTPGQIATNLFGPRLDFPTGSQPQRMAVADLDGDGKPDLIVANTGDGTISILQNISEGGTINFAPKVDITTGASCDAVAVGDLSGDGKPDIAAVNTDGTLSVLQNVISAPGTITSNSFAPQISLPIPSGGVDVAIVDIDGDGRPDLAVAAYLPPLFSIIQNLSSGGDLTANSFGQRIDYPLDGRGHTISIGDLDGDGKPDLVVDTELNSTISIFHNESTPGILTNSSLSGPIELATGWNAWGSSVGDLDGDGRPDIIFANTYDNNISIYQNLAPFGMAAPFITTQPASQVVNEGGTASICVTVSGSAPFNYQWKFNQANIPGATNAMLTLTNVHPYQAGNYSVVVASAYGRTASSNAMLTVMAETELVYNYSGLENTITAGSESTDNYSGEMFFIPGNTNGVFVGWATIKGKKQYWVQPFSDYVMVSIPGAGHTYTVLGKAGEGMDANGHPQIWSYLHKGRNANLNTGNGKFISFPDTFSFQSTDIYSDPDTGNEVMQDASSTYIFASAATQSANRNGQTVADLVNALVVLLHRQGYQSL
jgi:hypothetical protein